MAKFRKKPVVIDAVQWLGTPQSLSTIRAELIGPNQDVTLLFEDQALLIPTLEGTMRADKNDWIIKGLKGEVYPCKPDIFAQSYDPEPA